MPTLARQGFVTTSARLEFCPLAEPFFARRFELSGFVTPEAFPAIESSKESTSGIQFRFGVPVRDRPSKDGRACLMSS